MQSPTLAENGLYMSGEDELDEDFPGLYKRAKTENPPTHNEAKGNPTTLPIDAVDDFAALEARPDDEEMRAATLSD